MKEPELRQHLMGISSETSVVPADQLAAFAVDRLAPHAVVAPASIEQVAALMAFAHEHDLAVIPWGGGTAMGAGNIPRRYDIALVLTGLNAVLEHEPADLTVGVQAGIRLADLQRRLAEAGQFLPLDPPFAGQATIGGILATRASGPLRYAYGAPRDLMIGVTVVQADGVLTHAGGRVVKNVSGYDIGKLHIGALGTLGVIVEARFKIVPLPAVDRTLLLLAPTVEAAVELVFTLDRSNLGLKALTLLNAEAARAVELDTPAVAARIGGEEAAVEAVSARVARVATEAGAAWREVPEAETAVWEPVRRIGALDDGVGAVREPPLLTARASLLPTQVAAFIEALETISPATRPAVSSIVPLGSLAAAWDAGTVGETPLRIANELFQLAQRFGAHLWIEAAPFAVKERLEVWGPLPESFPLMQRLKAQLDPKGLLNPGRYVGGL